MSKIRTLSFHEAQKIAAGEVVERPASVVKELLENAIDAGATRITLTIKDGGRELIRMTDDGCGMSLEDARICIQKHATSKISCIDDLNTIATFGFRGEALAALAAVSRMTLITKEASTHQGIKLTVECGTIIKEEPVAAQTGTTVEIADLFYNVPARQKFLKKRETEFRHIQQLFNAMSLAHPSIHTQLYSQDSLIAHYTSTTDLAERCTQIISQLPHQLLIPIKACEHDVTITGLISDHQWFKYDRSHIYLFVNNRWIKNQSLARSIMRGYGNVLPPDRFPVVCIMIDVPAHEVDVNVHPRKEEVQFVHAHRIENIVSTTIKKAFENILSQRVSPAVFPAQSSMVEHANSFNSLPPLHTTTWQQPFITPHAYTYKPVMQQPLAQPSTSEDKNITVEDNQLSAIEQVQTVVEQESPFIVMGQLHNTYILVQTDEGLLLVDQHAAHERILYEQFASRFADVAIIQLLFPELITLTHNDWLTLAPYLDILSENGIITEQFGETQLRVLATPIDAKRVAITELVRHFIGIINEQERIETDECKQMLHHALRAQMACKAAVKAGDILEERQMKELLHNLYKVDNRLTCPHGRPTYWQLSRYEIEKKFKR